MKVDGTSISPVGSVQAINRVSQADKKALVSEKDNVAVSDKAQAYQALIQKVKAMPEVREERIRNLAEQIERGEFQVNGQKIAEKMFSPEFND